MRYREITESIGRKRPDRLPAFNVTAVPKSAGTTLHANLVRGLPENSPFSPLEVFREFIRQMNQRLGMDQPAAVAVVEDYVFGNRIWNETKADLMRCESKSAMVALVRDYVESQAETIREWGQRKRAKGLEEAMRVPGAVIFRA